MKAIFHERYGPPDVVEVREVDKPAIEDNQVLVKVHASSVNPAEWYAITGPWFARLLGGGIRRPKDPRVGADLAGRVEAVGADVTEFQPGDEVFGTSGAAWAEYARRPGSAARAEAGRRLVRGGGRRAHRGAHGPPGATRPRAGAAGPEGADQRRVRRRRHVRGADRQGARRGRDGRVLDAERRAGARRSAPTASSTTRRRTSRSSTCVTTSSSTSPAASRFAKLRRVLTPDATVVVVGAKFPANSGLGPLGHVIRMRLGGMLRSQKVKFFVAKITKEDLAVMQELLDSGKVKSIIDKTYELSQVDDALRYLGEGHARGKIVITM